MNYLNVGDRVYKKRQLWPGEIIEIEGDTYYGQFYKVHYDDPGLDDELLKASELNLEVD